LIPDFDESFVGYRDLRAKRRENARADATLLSRPLTIDGEVVGKWSWRLSPSRARLDVRGTGRLAPADVAAIQAAAQRYEAFAERPVTLEIA
jgi:hypothetical protein